MSLPGQVDPQFNETVCGASGVPHALSQTACLAGDWNSPYVFGNQGSTGFEDSDFCLVKGDYHNPGVQNGGRAGGGVTKFTLNHE